MMNIRKRLATVAVAFTVTVTGLVPAHAFQMPAPVAVQTSNSAQVTDVQYLRNERRWDRRMDRRAERRWDRRMDRRAGWYNGHRGYRDRRAGYRYHNGYWYPLAAFAAGAIIGGAASRPTVSSSSAHVRWCSERYRTYRASDNTYVPRAGVRAVCNSPY
ncbi:BA14K family protein [Neorhizobium sp. NPDC001467]|uniref:BA14K family protein n=1 Tax=Neorhizobium sp. NPDC001467 TaxID=3390595 RepID=UPI003D018884